ncbi:MAG: cystathionine beta-synthase [Elusimicrobia bacterium CG1_02_56_21]|nr:MAG: cystathionine beta-synthase [Elusimicrobia bacterium CG1_02_56_21]
MQKADTVLDLIGNTPLLKVQKLDTGKCELFLKLECQNPGGSIKDRIALSMIAAAEKEGKIGKGGTLVEATAGNTGLGLALVAAQKGYKLILVIPDKMSQEKISHLRALGAEIVNTRSDVEKGHPEYYQDMAERIARETPNSYFINQFGNPANPAAHEQGTAPEIWEQMEHKVDAVVCGIGSGGTLTGLGRFFARVSPATEMVLADPAGSVLADYIKTGKLGKAGSWFVEGIGEDFIPPVAEMSLVKKAYSITDEESFTVVRELLKAEGVLAGSSTGTLVAAALRYCRESQTPKRVVTIVGDSGNKYLSKMFNDYWMADQGFIKRTEFGDLRDLVGRPCSAGSVASVKPGDALVTAFLRMRMYEYTQLPVMEEGHVVGILDESDILMAVHKDASNYRKPVRDHMTHNLVTVQPSTPLEEITTILNKGLVGLLNSEGKFYGLITRVDLLNHLRRTLA